MKKSLLTLSLIATVAGASAQQTPLWLRANQISPDGKSIVFNYKGNLYVVDAKGGEARQLTSNPAYESNPIWTPDSKHVIFSSYREASKDIFSVPVTGGAPKQLTTYSGNETPLAVLKDGRVLFSANIQVDPQYDGFANNAQLYVVGPDGGAVKQITSLPIAELSVNDQGDVIYEDIKGYEDALRKHHTSSVTRDIWLYRPADKENFAIHSKGSFKKLSNFVGEDRNPVFAADGDTYFYLSEQDGTFNVYKSSVSAPGNPTQLTRFKGNPVRYLSVAKDGTLAFSYDGELYTMQEGKEPQKVAISITTDQIERGQVPWQVNGARSIAISPDGKEIASILRGDVYVTSVEHKTTKRITDTPIQERNVCFSKDGRTIYYSAERDGHWGIWATSLVNKKDKMFTYANEFEHKMITKPGETCFQPQVSPDGEKLAYLKDRTAIVVKDLKSGKEKELLNKMVNYSYTDGDQSFEWSPDSRYLLCNYQAGGSWNNENVALIDVESGEITDLTESGYSDSGFKWALGGKAMIWASDKHGYRSHGSWGSEYDVYIMFFDNEAFTKFHYNAEDRTIEDLYKEEKEKKKEEKEAEKAEKAKEENKEPKVEKLNLNLADRQNRIVKLTPYAGRIGDFYLTQDGKKLYYTVRLEKSMDLCVLNLEDRSINVVSKNIGGSFIPSKDNKFLYIASRGSIIKLDLASNKEERIHYSGDFTYRPAEEREYIFNHTWKQVKDKFYVEDIHGADWDSYKDIYAKFLPHIDNNHDFRELLSELLGELNGSHTGARYNPGASLNTGRLGVFFDDTHKGDGLKIKEVIKGGVLHVADPEIKAGDLVLAVNGTEITPDKNWYEYFQQLAGKRVALTVKKGGKKVDLFVKLAGADDYYNRWVEKRAKMTEELSGGRIGYIHVRGMDSESFREVYSKALGKYKACDAIIIDTRHNGGGWLHDDLVTFLSGKEYMRFEPRGQYIGSDPFNKWRKPSCVLIGEDNYSNAHGFPYVYKSLGIGKLIGAPVPGTMTAVWWETQIDESLIFGVPQVGCVGTKEGKYLENFQVEPDVLIYNDPASTLEGRDIQLETAVKEMLKLVEK